MTAEQVLIEKFRVLPEEKQAKLLEIIEELEKEPEAVNGSQPKQNLDGEARDKARFERVMSLVGMGRSNSGNVSERVDEILAEGANKREGWSLP